MVDLGREFVKGLNMRLDWKNTIISREFLYGRSVFITARAQAQTLHVIQWRSMSILVGGPKFSGSPAVQINDPANNCKIMTSNSI